jgi:hypothetical protein
MAAASVPTHNAEGQGELLGTRYARLVRSPADAPQIELAHFDLSREPLPFFREGQPIRPLEGIRRQFGVVAAVLCAKPI